MNIDHEANMRLAIQAALDAKQDGGVAIGAVVIDESTGDIIATGGSIVAIAKDPTAHAEVNAIREAARSRSTEDLYGTILYSTLEPCHMCLSAAAWAKIARIYFGAYRKDVDASLFDINGRFADEEEARRMNLRESTTMQVHGGILEAQCAALLKGFHLSHKHTL